MLRIVLFFGYPDEDGNAVYPRYRIPEDKEIYQTTQLGHFSTLVGHPDERSMNLPIQAEVKKILNDEPKKSRSIFLLAKSKEEFLSISAENPFWKEVPEGNP